jgi:hypothetical protein
MTAVRVLPHDLALGTSTPDGEERLLPTHQGGPGKENGRPVADSHESGTGVVNIRPPRSSGC